MGEGLYHTRITKVFLHIQYLKTKPVIKILPLLYFPKNFTSSYIFSFFKFVGYNIGLEAY